jgi:subtilase family serine protease
VRTDANSVPESDENNNWRATPITVTRTIFPDLIVQNIEAPDAAFFGQTINVRWTVKNVGDASTNTSQWSDRVYLSSDHTPANAVVQFNVLNVTYLDAGQTYVASADVRIPRGIFGTYYVIIRTDIAGAVAEDDENNNTLTGDQSSGAALARPKGHTSPAPSKCLWRTGCRSISG